MAGRKSGNAVRPLPEQTVAQGAAAALGAGALARRRAKIVKARPADIVRVAMGIDPGRHCGIGVVALMRDGSYAALAGWAVGLDAGTEARDATRGILVRPAIDIDVVAVEEQYASVNRHTGLVLSRLSGIAEGIAWYLCSPERVERLAPSLWRSALGLPVGPRTRAKAAALRYARLELGWETDNEDIADALCIARAAL